MRPQGWWNRRVQPSRRAVLRGLATGGTGLAIGTNAVTAQEADEAEEEDEDEQEEETEDADDADDADEDGTYDLEAAQRDGYWYFRHNGESVLLSGAGVQYPDREYGDEPALETFEDALDELEAELDEGELPVEGLTSLTIAPYETSGPLYATRPTFSPRPVQPTLRWDGEAAQRITPAGTAWFVQTAFELSRAFDELGDPGTDRDDVANGYAALYDLAGWHGLEYAFGNGGVLRDEESEGEVDEPILALAGSYDPGDDEATFDGGSALDYAATVWCLSAAARRDAVSPVVETAAIGIDTDDATTMADATARTIVEAYDAQTIADEGGVADVGVVLSALGVYGSVGTNDVLADAEEFGDELIADLGDVIDDDGRIDAGDGAHQAAVQGAVGQGLDLASDGLGLEADDADSVLSSLVDESWSDDDGTFDDERVAETIVYTVRDAGDVVGGLNAALRRLDEDAVREVTAGFMDLTVHNSTLQRAQLDAAISPDATYWLPHPENAGGWFGRAPVFNGAVEYRRDAGLWRITDQAFRPSGALYTACQFGWLATGDEALSA